MIRANDLIALFLKAREERWGYIWGKRGQVWTQAAQNAATREQTVKWGSRWVGKRVADCSGLFVWAYKELGESIYHGSNTIWKKHTSEKGDLVSGVRLPPGAAVFKVDEKGSRHHIGLHIGGGIVIEAKGTYYGVVRSRVDEWDEWGLLAAVDYTDAWPLYPVTTAPKTLRRGDRGDDVLYLQTLLAARGHNVGSKGPDGVFGQATQAAVRAFQSDVGLTTDGVVGPLTWAELEKVNGATPMEKTYTVSIRGLSSADADALLAVWGDRAEKKVMG